MEREAAWLILVFGMGTMIGKAVRLILMAIANNERIAAYGDFDADGVTSTMYHDDNPDIAWCECNSLYSIKSR